MRIIAIDPGTSSDGLVDLAGPETVLKAEQMPHEDVLDYIASCPRPATVVVEQIVSYGVGIGNDTLRTCEHAGAVVQQARVYMHSTVWLSRPAVCRRLMGSTRSASKGEVWQRVVDLYGGTDRAIGGVRCGKCKGKGWFGRGRPPCPAGCAEGDDGVWYETLPGPLSGVRAHCRDAMALAAVYLIDEGVINP